MRDYSKITKRLQAVILAVVLVFSAVNPVVWRGISAGADDIGVEISAAEIIAKNYDLSDAEIKLLNSGYLKGEIYEYIAPTDDDDLIDVKTSTKTISAKPFEKLGQEWIPTEAVLTAGDYKETVTLTDGKGQYQYDDDTFSVDVKYVLYVDIDADDQGVLLNAGSALKQGIANLDKISDNMANNLSLLKLAIAGGDDGYIGRLANGISVPFGGGTLTVKFATDAGREAAKALVEQYENNGGQFNLEILMEEYADADSKVAYLVENGKDVQDELKYLYPLMADFSADGIWTNEFMLSAIQLIDAQMYAALVGLKNSTTTWCDNAKPVVDDSWTAANTVYPWAKNPDAAFDIFVNAIDATAPEAKNPLVAAEATVKFNMSMFDVDVVVELYLANGGGTTARYDKVELGLVFAEGTSADAIKAAVEASGVIDEALAKWDGKYDEGKFYREESVLPSNLTSDVTYVITYKPNSYEVTYQYDSLSNKTLPYGTTVILPAHLDASLAYDYYVNGVKYAQGSTITIEGETNIDRELGKAYVDGSLYDIVANNFFANGTDAYKILTSDAILNDVVISARYPEAADNLVTLTNDIILEAKKYDSSYDGRVWAPYTYTIVGGEYAGEYKFNGATEVTLPTDDFDYVSVVYRLYLGNDLDLAKDIANIPFTLVSEAKSQMAALNRISKNGSVMSNLDALTPVTLGGLKGVIDMVPTISEGDKTYFKDVLTNLSKECFDGNTFKLYSLLLAYNQDGLIYYYNNSAKFINELEVLSKYLTMLAGDAEKQAILTEIVNFAGDEYSSYVGKITDLESIMAEVRSQLTAPNAMIDTDSANYAKLVEILENATALTAVETGKELYIESATFTKESTKKVVVEYSVNVVGKGVLTYTATFDKGHIVTVNDIAAIKNEIAGKVIALGLSGVNDIYYTTAFNASAFDAFVGADVNALKNAETSFTWTPKTVKVYIAGVDTGIVLSVNQLSVDLPKSVDAAYRYQYSLNGTPINVNKYTFSLAELADAIAVGSVNFEREAISVARENLTAFVNSLNDANAGNAIEFALVENNGKFSIVMKVNATQTDALMGAVQSTAMTLISSDYSYIGLDGNDVLYMDDEMNLKVSIQAVVDAVMDSGFGTQTLIDIMDSNGNINNVTINGEVISNENLGAWGGQLVKTTMQLGSAREGALNLDFYVTLGSAPAQLTQVRNLLAGQLKNYFNIVCRDGKVVMNLTMPQKAYEAYLAVLLATGNIDLSNIDAVNGEIAIGFIKDLVDPLFTGNVTTNTLTNTLSKFGYDLDLTGYENIYSKFCNKYSELEIVYDAKSATTSTKLNIAGIVDSIDIPGISGMIVEYSTGISFTGSAVLQNLGTDYEALYLDINASGVTNKAGLTTNLVDKLANIAGTSLVVLLDDVQGDLVFDNTTVLNLNGFTVTGDIVANGALYIVDSSLSNNGGVFGSISGNASIIAGTYVADVSAFLKPGYVQNNSGAVTNEFFDLVTDEDGNIVLELNAGILATKSMPSVKALALDVVLDLLFNGYTNNMLTVDGNKMFEFTYSDFVALYAGSDRLDTAIKAIAEMIDSPAIANVLNTIIEDVTDFASIKKAIENNEYVASYNILTGSWKPVVEHIEDGDYITVGISTGAIKERTFNIAIVGSEADKANLAGMMDAFDDTVDVEAKIELDHGFEDDNLVFDWSASGKLVIDLTHSTNKYAIMLGAIVADGVGAPANAQLVEGIRRAAEGDIVTLQRAFDALTTKQVIASISKLTPNDDFADMITSLGLDGVISEDVMALEGDFDALVKLFAAVIRKANIEGGDRTVGSYFGADGIYTFHRANVTKTFTREIAKGYSVTINAEVKELDVSIKLFGELKAPEFVDGTGIPAITESNKIAGYFIDTDNGIIYIDVNILSFTDNGITVKNFVDLVNLYAINADVINKTVKIGDEIKADGALVCTGDKLVATAENGTVNSDMVEYTIIVVGDVNKNGRTDTGDASLIASNYVGLEELDYVQKLAADIGRNGRVDVGDAALVATKYVTEWENYESAWAK